MIELIVTAGGDLHFQLVVHFLGGRHADRDFSDEAFFLFAVDRTAQSHPAIDGDDFHVPGVYGQAFAGDDFFANLGSRVHVGLAAALIERSQGPAVAITNILPGVISVGRPVGGEVWLNLVGTINSAGVTGLA